VALLSGTAGSGKSRLLVDAETMAHHQHSRVLRIRGFLPEQTAPLLAATRLLAELLHHESGEAAPVQQRPANDE